MSVQHVDHFVSVTSRPFICVSPVCVGEAVFILKKHLYFTDCHLNVYIMVLQFAQGGVLTNLNFEKGPETQEGWREISPGQNSP